MADKAFIYILTNKAFSGHNWVKIGYAKDVEKRRKSLSTTAIPFPYEIYATYEIEASAGIADKQLHKLITRLNPSLRLAENREFFEMTPEAAFDLLEALAVIHNRKDKLIRYSGGKPVIAEPQSTETPMEQNQGLPLLKDYHDLVQMKTRGGIAEMSVDTGSFVLKAGSVIKLRFEQSNPARKKHEEDLSSGLLLRKGDYAILQSDKEFPSPSAAGQYVTSNPIDGWAKWRAPNGKTLDEVAQRK